MNGTRNLDTTKGGWWLWGRGENEEMVNLGVNKDEVTRVVEVRELAQTFR
jgi:hypothetical protein